MGPHTQGALQALIHCGPPMRGHLLGKGRLETEGTTVLILGQLGLRRPRMETLGQKGRQFSPTESHCHPVPSTRKTKAERTRNAQENLVQWGHRGGTDGTSAAPEASSRASSHLGQQDPGHLGWAEVRAGVGSTLAGLQV